MIELSGITDPTRATDALKKPPIRFRWTRIAASAIFCVLALSLFAFALLSFNKGVAFVKTEGTGTQTRYGIDNGYLYFRRSYGPGFPAHGWRLGRDELYRPRLEWISGYANRKVMVPCWVVVGVLAAGAALPWVRFSLRTLLIAATAVAVMLGLSVWLLS